MGLLMACPSSHAQQQKGFYLLQPGPSTYSEQKILQFFGQVRGCFLK